MRSESEDRHGASPKDQTHRVRKIEDNSGDATLRVDTSLPSVASVTSSAPLRPNRLGPNGDIELGGAVNPPGTGEWVNNWTSRYRSPLGKPLMLFHRPTGRTDYPQMLCNDEFTD